MQMATGIVSAMASSVETGRVGNDVCFTAMTLEPARNPAYDGILWVAVSTCQLYRIHLRLVHIVE